MTRREVLRAYLGVALLGCDEEPELPEIEGDLLGQDHASGHLVRDAVPASLGDWDRAPSRAVKVAILGGGIAGLAAAWRLERRGFTDYALFDLEPVLGGTSRADRSHVTAYPWAAHYVPVPADARAPITELLREVGAIERIDAHGRPVGAEHLLVRRPEERLFLHGFWQEGLFPWSGASEDDRAQYRRFQALVAEHAAAIDGAGRRAFALPIASSSTDTELLALDRLSAAAFLEERGFTSPRLRWFLEYATRDDYGTTLEHTSAWALLFYYASRSAGGADSQPFLTWPAGNGALVDHFASIAGERARAGAMAVDVVPDGDRVRVHLLDTRDRKAEVVVAERVIVAMPRFVAERVVRPLREGPRSGFEYGSWMVANVHLADRPFYRGFETAWDNVIYESPSLGYVVATHQRGRDVGPTVWTYYYPLVDADPRTSRQRLFDLAWSDWKEIVVRDLARAHPGLGALVRRIDVFRWGHAMIRPTVGFRSVERERAAQAIGRIYFAHSDLSGVALFEEAFAHGVRAADEILAERPA
jgi:glycine/D-amino acid oxidase-like deaminating enzyme